MKRTILDKLSVCERARGAEECAPVDGGDDWVQRKGSAIHVVLLPDLSISRVPIIGTVESVVDSNDEGQDPGDESKNLVGEDRTIRVGFPLTKGIVFEWVSRDG
jgi:hypothetical protein